MAPQQQTWARLRADYGCPLRRGAWYRVVSISPLEAVVDVDQKPVLLPREYVEIVASRPSRWTVVQDPERSPRLPGGMSGRCAARPRRRGRPAAGATADGAGPPPPPPPAAAARRPHARHGQPRRRAR